MFPFVDSNVMVHTKSECGADDHGSWVNGFTPAFAKIPFCGIPPYT